MVDQFWASVADWSPTLNRHWFNIPGLLGINEEPGNNLYDVVEQFAKHLGTNTRPYTVLMWRK